MPTRKSDTGKTGDSASETDIEAGRDESGRVDVPTVFPADAESPPPETAAPDAPSTPELSEPVVFDAVIEDPVMTDVPQPADDPFHDGHEVLATPDAPVQDTATSTSFAPTPPTPPVHTAAEHDEVHEEEEGSSFAAKALTGLLLLLVGAGAGIWAAPRIAPLLPAGMAPVADWLAPGSEKADAEIAALQARLDQGLTEVRASVAALPAPADAEASVNAAVGAVDGRLTAEIDALKQSLDGADATAIIQRLAQLEAGVEGQAAELSTLKEQIAGAATTADASGVDVYRGELDGVRAELGSLQDKVGALTARLDQVSAEANRQIETAQTQVASIQAEAETQLSAADAQANLALVDAAIASGQPFKDALDKLSGREGVTIPAGLAAAAPTGVASLASLRDSFGTDAHEAIRASILATAAGEGVLARARAFVEAQVASRSLTPQAGVGPNAVLSRMEDKLRHDDLDGALTEASQLPSEAAAAMGGWLAAAKLRAGAVDGYAELERSLAATN